MRLYNLYPVLLLVMCSACSISMPLSETYMFSGKKIKANELYLEEDSLSWKSTKGLSFSINDKASEIKRYIKKNHQVDRYRSLTKPAIAFSSATQKEHFSWGYNIGYSALGLNITSGVGWNNYVTLNAGVYGGGELIIQHKIFQYSNSKSTGGMGLGAFFRRDYFGYDEPITPGHFFYGLPELVPVNIYGGRGMFHFRFFYEVMIHGFVSYGYAQQLDTGLFNIGFIIGTDVFK